MQVPDVHAVDSDPVVDVVFSGQLCIAVAHAVVSHLDELLSAEVIDCAVVIDPAVDVGKADYLEVTELARPLVFREPGSSSTSNHSTMALATMWIVIAHRPPLDLESNLIR